MKIGLRQFENDDVEWFRKAVAGNAYSRYGLAKELCLRVGWRGSGGKLSVTQAYLALPKLARELSVSLPEVCGSRPVESSLPEYSEAPSVSCAVEQLGAVSVEPVAPADTKRWRAMMRDFHPRGEPHLPGKALKYWITSERCGRLGGLSFHAASWHEKARDEHIGWGARARVANLGLVVNNARFLILPEVRVYGLASSVLDIATGRLGADWQAAYGETPALAYTHIDQSHTGTSYRAAGWAHVGETSGRKCSEGEKKQVFMRPLCDNWRARLCGHSSPRFRPVVDAYLKDEATWTDVEYGGSTHPDGRVAQRILSMGNDWRLAPGDQMPQKFACQAKMKAAYRLLNSDNVDMDDILESHRQASAARCALYPTVLAVQDTTTLNYDALKHSTEGLTKIGGTAKGIMAHVNLALTPAGRMLGVLDIDGQFRNRCAPEDAPEESIRWIEGFETASELASACGAGTRVVSVCDREGDIWELFERQAELNEAVGLLVRSNAARRRKTLDDDDELADLSSHVEGLEPVASRPVQIEAQGGKRARKARKARVSLRIARVQIKAPGKNASTLPLIAVSAMERKAPTGHEPLNWFLLCSEGEADSDNAARIVGWYEKRWGIEEYFRVVKSGCQVEKRQFDDAEDMLKCLAFDAITAWRVFDLHRMAKYEPNLRAAEVIEAEEFKVLEVLLFHIGRRLIRPPPEMTILEYTVDLGRISGFRPTNRQPMPGTKILWMARKKQMESIQTINAYNAYNAMQQD